MTLFFTTFTLFLSIFVSSAVAIPVCEPVPSSATDTTAQATGTTIPETGITTPALGTTTPTTPATGITTPTTPATGITNPTGLPTPPATGKDCKTFVVDGIPGGFTSVYNANFTSVKPGQDVSKLLKSFGLTASNWRVPESPKSHTFTPKNVLAGNGSLDLKVSAYSGQGDVIGAEIVTNEEFKYASVRAVIKSTPVPGVCIGSFFWKSDTQEIDYEILTSTAIKGNRFMPAGLWATNHPTTRGGRKVSEVIPFTEDPSSRFMEYRIDWTAAGTDFYLDGVKKATITKNIANQAGPWMINAWSNGNNYWSAGPPTQDAITQIQSLVIYKGYKASATGNVCKI